MRRRLLLGAALPSWGLCACVSIGSDGTPRTFHRLHDAGVLPARRPQALVPALLIQALPADAQADTTSIAYSRQANEFAHYQLAFWSERPTRQLPRLLQRRLEARGLAEAVGQLGDPLRADWLLAIGIESLHHDLSVTPSRAQLALYAELFDRREHRRIARRQFEAQMPCAAPESAAAAAALSGAVAKVFDDLLPWLEGELERVSPAGRRQALGGP